MYKTIKDYIDDDNEFKVNDMLHNYINSNRIIFDKLFLIYLNSLKRDGIEFKLREKLKEHFILKFKGSKKLFNYLNDQIGHILIIDLNNNKILNNWDNQPDKYNLWDYFKTNEKIEILQYITKDRHFQQKDKNIIKKDLEHPEAKKYFIDSINILISEILDKITESVEKDIINEFRYFITTENKDLNKAVIEVYLHIEPGQYPMEEIKTLFIPLDL